MIILEYLSVDFDIWVWYPKYVAIGYKYYVYKNYIC
jgi:hypothetical protein